MKRLLPLLAALVVLSGCSAMLNRDYSSSAVHVEYPVSEDASILQAENYQGLVNAILYFVTEHESTGVIHLSNYTSDVGTDLAAACTEVRTEDPLGSYAIKELRHDYTRIVSYYEVTISIDYAHTVDEVAAIVPVTGSSAIKRALSGAMTTFSDGCLLRISYFTGDQVSLEALARQTFLDTPLALHWPEVSIKLYPDSGTSRIAEVEISWPKDKSALKARSIETEERAQALLQDLGERAIPLTAENLLAALLAETTYAPDGAADAYAVLVEGAGNDQGMALALRLLCELGGLEATVVEGSLAEEPRFWVITATSEGYRHLDPAAEQPQYATDEQYTAAGYVWRERGYPECIDYAAAKGDPTPDGAV